MKFGVFLPFYAFQKSKTKHPREQWKLLRETVLECERLGYHSVWLDDHVMYQDWPILECWTTLSALSSITTKIRLGTMVSCISHRNPALLAKIAATFDIISNGRLEVGVGAGTQRTEHIAYGMGFPEASVRIERLNEALEIIKRLWSEEKANYKGKHYRLKDATCEPKPVQKPRPPITVGGNGERLLKVTARHADRFDFGFMQSLEEYKKKLEILRNYCRTFDRNFEEIERSCWPGGQVLIASSQVELDAKISKVKPAGISFEDFKNVNLVGTPDECAERLKVLNNFGVTQFMLFFGDLPDLDGIRVFAKKFIQ